MSEPELFARCTSNSTLSLEKSDHEAINSPRELELDGSSSEICKTDEEQKEAPFKSLTRHGGEAEMKQKYRKEEEEHADEDNDDEEEEEEEDDIGAYFIEAKLKQNASETDTIDLLAKMSSWRFNDQRCELPRRPIVTMTSTLSEPHIRSPSLRGNEKKREEEEKKKKLKTKPSKKVKGKYSTTVSFRGVSLGVHDIRLFLSSFSCTRRRIAENAESELN